jgi:hypothetical protein
MRSSICKAPKYPDTSLWEGANIAAIKADLAMSKALGLKILSAALVLLRIIEL